MNIKLFTNNEPPNKLNKSINLEDTTSFDLINNATFISENNRKSPVFRINTSTNLTNRNYCYIDGYNRFYFCKVVNIATNLYLVTCETDLLMTCKSEIGGLSCTISRSSSDGSNYLYDDKYRVQVFKKYVTKKFPYGMENDTFILQTVGNKVNP